MSIRVSLEMMLQRPDLLFVPSQGLPIVSARKTVTTVHDVGFRRVPEAYSDEARQTLGRVTRDAVTRADLLLTVSAFSNREIVEMYGVDASRIVVTPLASVMSRRSLPRKPFFLFVGRLERKKGVADLVRAFTAFKASRPADDPFELVLAGPRGYGYEEIKSEIRNSKYEKDVREIGYVPEHDVARLMGEAAAFVFPSRYEGFGMPLLEAMACSTPVIASDIPVFREVAGESALFVPVGDVQALAAALTRMADDRATRESFAHSGRERVKTFSWDETARLTWESIRNVLD